MEKSKQTIDESLNKMKYLMGYDSSMTRIENIESVIEEQEDPMDIPTEENSNCPNAIPYMELVSKMKKVAHIVRRMNTAFVRMVGSGKRVQFIYQTMKSFRGMNTYAEDFDECVPALQAATAYFNGYFSDWFSKGETFEEEIGQLIRRKYYRNDPVVQKYLKETLKLLQPQATKTKPEEMPGETRPDQESGQAPASTTGGYKFVKGTTDDPYKYGSLGSGIAQVQQALGITQDGKWGPITQSKMTELAPEYVNGYTNEDLLKVIQAIRSKTNTPIQKSGSPTAAPVAPKTDTTTLAKTNMSPIKPMPEKKKGWFGELLNKNK